MGLHIVLGDGEMTKKELVETLKNLWDETGKDESFWFVVQGKSEPTTTDRNLVQWLNTNQIYYEVLTDDAESMDDLYENSQNTHTAKQLARKVVSLLKAEDGEADVLALYVSDDSQAEEDRWLNTVAQQAHDAEPSFGTFVLNDGMVPVDIGGESSEADEGEEEEAKPSKTPAKKAVAKPAPVEDDEDEQEEESVPPKKAKKYTRDDLEDMDLSQLKEIAAERGISLAPRTRPKTYIDHILGEAAPTAPEAEITTPPVTITGGTSTNTTTGTNFNGSYVDMNDLAERVAFILVQKIAKALQPD